MTANRLAMAMRAETGVIEEEVTEDALPSSAARVLGLFSDAQDIEDEESAEGTRVIADRAEKARYAVEHYYPHATLDVADLRDR